MQDVVYPLLLLEISENTNSMLKNIQKKEQGTVLSVTFTP